MTTVIGKLRPLPGHRCDRLHRRSPRRVAGGARLRKVRALARNPDKLADVAVARPGRGGARRSQRSRLPRRGLRRRRRRCTTSCTRWAPPRISSRRRSVRPSNVDRGREEGRRAPHRLLSGLHPTGELSRHLRVAQHRGEDPDRVGRRDRRAAGGHRHRLGFGVVRDGPASDRPTAGHDDPEVGAQQDPADLDRRRAALPRRGGRRPPCRSRAPGTSGGPDVLEYGDAMQVYAEEAGLRRRVIVALPLLTPSIASWWVGLVTPIPRVWRVRWSNRSNTTR